MLVAGVDVGNSTTEIAVARTEPGREPEWLFVARRPTTGAKGSEACAEGVAELLAAAERRVGERAHVALLAELHPVETGLVELGRLGGARARADCDRAPGERHTLGDRRRRRDARCRGRARRSARAEPIVPVVAAGIDYEDAAGRLRDARAGGWNIIAAIVEADDAVLIGNRFDRSLPIVDEVADAASLPLGARAAVEVAEPGASVEELSDPLRLGVLLGFGPEEARAARTTARALAGHRAALAVRVPRSAATGSAPTELSIVLVGSNGGEKTLDEHASPPPPGAVAAIRGSAGDRDGLLDIYWHTLPVPVDDPGFARRLIRRRAVALALLARGESSGLVEAIGRLCPGGARVVARESDAAVLGASTTPGAGRAPFVLDLGGGTVDLHRAEGAVSTAGAGDLVTRICAGLLDCDSVLAERAKRRRSARVETPFVLHHEDGSRSFLGEPAPPEALAHLCLVDGRGLVPLLAPLAPEVWRGLRRAAKRDVLARNVRRAIETVGGVPAGELVTLVGGSASDGEVVDVVAAELADLDVAVARGDVLGRHGPRAAVAVGLVLAFAEADGR